MKNIDTRGEGESCVLVRNSKGLQELYDIFLRLKEIQATIHFFY